ncbi:MAG: sensor histidine kinase [Lachnospiraceae bacterium]
MGIEPERLRLLNLSLSQMRRPEPGNTHHFIGLLNVHQRIRGYYGEEYGLMVESSPGEGTIVEIRLPYNRRPQLPSDPLPL